MQKAFLAIDAGGHSFKYCFLDYGSLQPLTMPVYVPIDDNMRKDSLLNSFAEIISTGINLATEKKVEIAAVAFSNPGPFDYFAGISLMEHKWKAIKGVSLKAFLYEKGLPKNVPIYFCHDTHSLILGEIACGEAKRFNTIAGFIIGTGLGFGICVDGILQSNKLGAPVFAFFQRPYRDGTIEDYVASKGIPRWYAEITGDSSPLTAKQIADLADTGNKSAIQAYEKMGSAIAVTVADFLNEFKVNCLVFGGRISNSFPIFIPAFKSEIRRLCPIEPYMYKSQSSELLSMQGAAFYAKTEEEKLHEKVL